MRWGLDLRLEIELGSLRRHTYLDWNIGHATVFISPVLLVDWVVIFFPVGIVDASADIFSCLTDLLLSIVGESL